MSLGPANAELVHQRDLDAVAEMFVAAFPELVDRRFRRMPHAVAFYRDLFSMVLATNASSFLAHRAVDDLVGYAAVTWPSRPLTKALWRAGRWWRLPLRALGGAYGFHPRLATGTLRQLLSRDHLPSDCESRPCLYAIVVRAGLEGRGIGRELVRRAKAAAGDAGLWLLVGQVSARARRLYESEGFRTIMTRDDRDVMLWTGQD